MELVISDSLSLSEDNLATLTEAPKSLQTSQPCSPGPSRLPINTQIQPENNLRRDSEGSAEANRGVSFMPLIHSVFDQGHKLAEFQRTRRCLAASVPNTFSETLMQEQGCIGKKPTISHMFMSLFWSREGRERLRFHSLLAANLCYPCLRCRRRRKLDGRLQ